MSYAMLWFNPSTILRHYFKNLSVRWGVDNAEATDDRATSVSQSVCVDKIANADAADAADAIQVTTSVCLSVSVYKVANSDANDTDAP